MASKTFRERMNIAISPKIKNEWAMWIFFLSNNSVSPWKTFNNVFLQEDITSDASGRAFADVPLDPQRLLQANSKILYWEKIFK